VSVATTKKVDYEFHPLTADRFDDFETLFGERGACGGCWCMWWRLDRKTFDAGKGAKNRRAMKKVVDSGEVPGILVYRSGVPIGWCALAPRERYPRLARSRVLAPVDERPVWSVVCFFVAKPWRRRGITRALLEAAVAWAGEHGARIVEGYPVVARRGAMPDAFAYTGLPGAFEKAGFREVARRSPSRPIVRREIRR